MAANRLAHAPLVEAIFEAHWSPNNGSPVDPHHKLFVGRLFDRLQADFPEPEELPTAQIPDGAAVGVIQQRFRRVAGGWPLVQLGPGILTVNQTTEYEWETYRNLCVDVMTRLFAAHPKPETLRFDSLIIRYIDAVPLEIAAGDVWSFLRSKMRVTVEFPEDLFRDMPVRQQSDTFSLQATFVSEKPPGRVALNFSMGKKHDKPALLWETTVASVGTDVPKLPNDFRDWLESAHTITHDWFQKLITGELEKTFRE